QLIANGNAQNNPDLPGAASGSIPGATITIDETANTEFDGQLVDTNAEYDRGSGVPAGPLSVAKTGTGTLTLHGTLGYTGTTTISQGVVSLQNIPPFASAASLVLDGGALQYTGPGVATGGLFTVNGTGGTLDAS